MQEINIRKFFLILGFVLLTLNTALAFPDNDWRDTDESFEKTMRERMILPSSQQTGTAEISGHIMDEEGSAVQNAYIELYPNLPNLKFSYFGYFKITKSDDEGNYTFKNLPMGDYIIGINLGHSPDFDVPYPRTFYPGSKFFSHAQVIGVNDGQKLRIMPFVVPVKLKVVKITGKLLWKDGLPIDEVHPVHKRRDIHDWSVDLRDTLPLGTTYPSIGSSGFFTSFKDKPEDQLRKIIKIDDQGNFTLWAFEGYSYILSAYAFDSDANGWHTNIIITTKENMEPLELKLSLKGSGTDEEIRKELGEALDALNRDN